VSSPQGYVSPNDIKPYNIRHANENLPKKFFVTENVDFLIRKRSIFGGFVDLNI
jgi:hypothetical protein